MDLGVWMNADTLEEKLEARDERNPEQAWNMARWPTRLSEPGEHRLVVASDGFWCGYFKVSGEALFNPEDERTPYTLLFDTRTWTEIPRTPAKRFRGFTYNVPAIEPASAPRAAAVPRLDGPGAHRHP